MTSPSPYYSQNQPYYYRDQQRQPSYREPPVQDPYASRRGYHSPSPSYSTPNIARSSSQTRQGPPPGPQYGNQNPFPGVLINPGDPAARAWAEYYTKGGTDTAGLVYFIPETVQGWLVANTQYAPPPQPERQIQPQQLQQRQPPSQVYTQPLQQPRERVPSTGSYQHHAFQAPSYQHAHSQSLPSSSYPYQQPQQPPPQRYDPHPTPMRQQTVPQSIPGSQPGQGYGGQQQWPPLTQAPSPNRSPQPVLRSSPMSSPNRTPSTQGRPLPQSESVPVVQRPHSISQLPSSSFPTSSPNPSTSFPPSRYSASYSPLPTPSAIVQPQSAFPVSSSQSSIASSVSASSQNSVPSVVSRSETTRSRPLPVPTPSASSITTIPQRGPMNPQEAFAAVRARQEQEQQQRANAPKPLPPPARSMTLPAPSTPASITPASITPTAITPAPTTPAPTTPTVQTAERKEPLRILPTPGAKVPGGRPLPSPSPMSPNPSVDKGKRKATVEDMDHWASSSSEVTGPLSPRSPVSPTMSSLPPAQAPPPRSPQLTHEEKMAQFKAEAQRRIQEKMEKFRALRTKPTAADTAGTTPVPAPEPEPEPEPLPDTLPSAPELEEAAAAAEEAARDADEHRFVPEWEPASVEPPSPSKLPGPAFKRPVPPRIRARNSADPLNNDGDADTFSSTAEPTSTLPIAPDPVQYVSNTTRPLPVRSPSAFGAARSVGQSRPPSAVAATNQQSVTRQTPPLSSPPRFSTSLPQSSLARPGSAVLARGLSSTPSTPGLTESSGTSEASDVDTPTQGETSEEDMAASAPRPRALPQPPPGGVRSPSDTPRQQRTAPEPQSMALRMAAMSLRDEEASATPTPTRVAPPPVVSTTPRGSVSSAPSAGSHRAVNSLGGRKDMMYDLDDRPPESLRRTPSPSPARVVPQPSTPVPVKQPPAPSPVKQPVSPSGVAPISPAPSASTSSSPTKRFAGGNKIGKDDYSIPTASSRALPTRPPLPSLPSSSSSPQKQQPSRPTSRVLPPAKITSAPTPKPAPSAPSVPTFSFPDEEEVKKPPPKVTMPSFSISSAPSITVNVSEEPTSPTKRPMPTPPVSNGGRTPVPPPSVYRKGSLRCAGCDGLIVGRIVSAMDRRWHPGCFKCTRCEELLEHVSSYEHEGRAYCHLDYHELFAPKCYHCKTSIADERFITVTDPGLDDGKMRYYHELHFFCAECGDPFLHPSASSAAPKGQRPGIHEDGVDDLGYTVYRGHPYCEACHVRLRMPKCFGCNKSIRDEVVEALDHKWHYHCFVCTTCKVPFEDPSFFQRGDNAYCDGCYRILLKSEM